ncbi:MAG: ATP-binding cassette domain-containing protein [Synergistaceae bacterium]|jgi:putative ABC transport system ATP-binding protein|nr:ATP-binding cassette domain-containing protein [Synergistaceae bacterium]
MLDVRNARATFLRGTPNERAALSNLSLTLEGGEFITIIGSNGAGKSTLFNAISGSLLLDSGSITLGGEDITWKLPHERALSIGYLFQNPMKGTAPNMTIAENISLAYSRKKIRPLRKGVSKGDLDVFRDMLARFGMGLEDRMAERAGHLSGGQRQALTLLMATVANPSLLLLDEHTAALDPAAAEKIMGITNEIVAERKLSTMMITHNIQQALRFGSRTVMMEDGSVILDITGPERSGMTVHRLMELYSGRARRELDNDRMLL